MNDITKLVINLHERSYPIYIGQDILNQNLIRPYIQGRQVLIVTNNTVAPLYLERVQANFGDLQCDNVILPDGENYKNWETLHFIFDDLIKLHHLRSTTLIALGGGVIGDMTGFAAACYQRGVHFIQIPTTLLSQVDASVGGKTAINHPLAKNMIGAFHQPKAVFIDINTLATLPKREFSCGLAEVIKAALICDAEFFYWLEEHIDAILQRDSMILAHAIRQACSIKIKIVVADEKEANIRALLNFGHTFGHALEQLSNYQGYYHGEAVAVGMVLASEYSKHIGWLDEKSVQRIKNLLTMANLPIRLPNSFTPGQLIERMGSDKKKDSSGLKLVLLKALGQAVLSSSVDSRMLEEVIEDHQLVS